MEEEIWKGVVGYEDLYEVSNTGKVRRADTGASIKAVKTAREKYLVIGLWRNGKAKVRRLHRIVAETFIPNPDNKPCIDHIDTNVFNNSVDNLRWCSYKENANNPLTLKHNSESQIEYNKKEGAYERNVARVKKARENNKEAFDRVTKKLVDWSKSDEGRKVNSESLKRYFSDPENVEKNRQTQKAYIEAHPEKIEEMSRRTKERMKNPKEREKVFLGSLHRAKPVKCLETGETFLSGGQADRKYGLWAGSANCCATRGIGALKGKLHFVFI